MIADNWRALVGASVLFFGLWGFLAKLASRSMPWSTMTLVIVTVNFAIMAATVLRAAPKAFTRPGVFFAAAAGVCAALGSLAHYRSLSLAPASLVIPMSSLYVMVTVVLSIALLGEPLTPRIGMGILLGIVSLTLLSSGAPH